MSACQPKLSPDFTSCDWGTTHLRVRRVVEGRVVAEDVSENGVSRVRGNFSEVLRLSMQKIKASPPVVVSGMAGSSIGWHELPLGELFRVRTRQVLDGCPSESNGSYLDGLLIGSELSGIEPGRPLLVAAGEAQYLGYKTAIEALGLAPQTRILPPEETALLAVRGQSRLLHCKLLI